VPAYCADDGQVVVKVDKDVFEALGAFAICLVNVIRQVQRAGKAG